MKALLLTLSLLACAPRQGPWVVSGADPALSAQALALVDAAKVVMPGSYGLTHGGRIFLAPDIWALCYPGSQAPPRYVLTGCEGQGAVYVRWPLGACPDLTCSALPHELGHLGLNAPSDDQANAMGLLIVQEFRRAVK